MQVCPRALVRCPYSGSGCTAMVRREELRKHVRACGEFVCQCRQGCGIKGLKMRDRLEHELTCLGVTGVQRPSMHFDYRHQRYPHAKRWLANRAQRRRLQRELRTGETLEGEQERQAATEDQEHVHWARRWSLTDVREEKEEGVGKGGVSRSMGCSGTRIVSSKSGDTNSIRG